MKKIITLHSISENTFSPKKFISYIQTLSRLGVEFLSLEELIKAPDTGVKMSLTFDDGYKDNYTNLLPLLLDFDIKATLFVCPFHFGSRVENSTKNKFGLYPNRDMMDADDIKIWMERGQEIGYHTHKHIDLYNTEFNEIEKDFEEGVLKLSEYGLTDLKHFAYPFGHLPKDRIKWIQLLERHQFKYGFTVNWGSVNSENKYFINRTCLGDSDSPLWLLMKSSNLLDKYYEIRYSNLANEI